MSKVKLLISTVDKQSTAESLAHSLIEEGVAACVNILPQITSVYRWKGSVETDQEHLMIIKTSADTVEETISLIEKLHPYDVPEIIGVDITAGSKPYLDWVIGETGVGD